MIFSSFFPFDNCFFRIACFFVFFIEQDLFDVSLMGPLAGLSASAAALVLGLQLTATATAQTLAGTLVSASVLFCLLCALPDAYVRGAVRLVVFMKGYFPTTPGYVIFL